MVYGYQKSDRKYFLKLNYLLEVGEVVNYSKYILYQFNIIQQDFILYQSNIIHEDFNCIYETTVIQQL